MPHDKKKKNEKESERAPEQGVFHPMHPFDDEFYGQEVMAEEAVERLGREGIRMAEKLASQHGSEIDAETREALQRVEIEARARLHEAGEKIKPEQFKRDARAAIKKLEKAMKKLDYTESADEFLELQAKFDVLDEERAIAGFSKLRTEWQQAREEFIDFLNEKRNAALNDIIQADINKGFALYDVVIGQGMFEQYLEDDKVYFKQLFRASLQEFTWKQCEADLTREGKKSTETAVKQRFFEMLIDRAPGVLAHGRGYWRGVLNRKERHAVIQKLIASSRDLDALEEFDIHELQKAELTNEARSALLRSFIYNHYGGEVFQTNWKFFKDAWQYVSREQAQKLIVYYLTDEEVVRVLNVLKLVKNGVLKNELLPENFRDYLKKFFIETLDAEPEDIVLAADFIARDQKLSRELLRKFMQSGNVDMILALLKVSSDILQESSFKDIFKTLLDGSVKGGMKVFFRLLKKIDPPLVLSKNKLNSIYEELFDDYSFEEIGELRAYFQIEPEQSLISQFLNEYLRGRDGARITELCRAVPSAKRYVQENGFFKTLEGERAALNGYATFIGRKDIAGVRELHALSRVEIKVRADDVQYCYFSLVKDGRQNNRLMRELEDLTGIAPDWNQIGWRFTEDIRKFIKTGNQKLQHSVWYSMLTRLRKIQDFSEHEGHDPWRNDLQPLLDRARFGQTFLPENSEADAELFLSFVKDFGALNLRNSFALYVDLKRHPDPKTLKESHRTMLDSALGKNTIDRLPNSEAILNELRKFKRKTQETLLRDEIPSTIETALGREIFDGLRGTTRWEQGSSLDVIVRSTQRVEERKPGAFNIKNGYEEKKFFVEAADSAGTSDAFTDEDERIRKQAEILAHPDLRVVFGGLREVIKKGFDIVDLRSWWNVEREKIEHSFSQTITKAREKLATADERARMGIERNIANLEAKTQEIKKLDIDQSIEEGDVVLFMEALFRIGARESEKIVQILSLYHAKRVMGEAWKETVHELARGDDPLTMEKLGKMSGFLVEYIREHYLHASQAVEHTGHTPFGKELRKALESLWQVKEDPQNHIIIQSYEKLKDVSLGERGSVKGVGVTLVPARKLLCSFSGDIGDACFARLNKQISENKYPNMTAVIMVTNRGEAQERLAGSVLFMEATTHEGENVLLIRGNNPRENLLARVDAGALTDTVIEYAIEIAKKRGIDKVAIPLDGRGRAGTNRQKVANYYKKQFLRKRKIELQVSAETTFNGYQTWNPRSDSPSVVIWDNKNQQK